MTRPLPGEDATPLAGTDKDRWDAARSQAAALSQGVVDRTLDDESLAGGLAALAQVPLDVAKVRDALHLPEDAGEHAAGLEQMLRRIPDGWGRWVRCDAGWYALLVRLDEQISALLPEYEIHQMKEKYGTLRFYWSLPELTPRCCAERARTDPRPLPEPVPAHLAPKGRTPQMQAAMEAWFGRAMAHRASPEHEACEEQLRTGPEVARRAAAVPQVRALVEEAQRLSAVTCERCGAPGALTHRGFWVKTLCGPCADELDFALNDED